MKHQIKTASKLLSEMELCIEPPKDSYSNQTIRSRVNQLIISCLARMNTNSLKNSFSNQMSFHISLIVCMMLIVGTQLSAQVTIGSWESHNPMSSFSWIGETHSHVYAANRYGVLAYDRSTESTEALTKVNYLTSNEISFFKCSDDRSVCIIGYSDGDLDLIDNAGSITNQPAIKNSQAIGDKRINDISFSEEFAWIASGVGIIKLNLASFNIQEYAEVNFEGKNQDIKRLFHTEEQLYMVTNQTILQTSTSDLFIEPNYIELQTESAIDRIEQVFQFNGQLFYLYTTDLFLEDTIYQFKGSSWSAITPLSGRGIRNLSVYGDTLLVTHSTSITQYNTDFEPISTEIFTYGPTGMNPSRAEKSRFSNKLIAADLLYGGIEVSPTNQFNATIFGVSSPFPESAQLINLDVIGDEVFVVPGGNEYTYNRPDIHRFKNGAWTSTELRNSEHINFVNGNSVLKIDEELFVASDRGGIAILNEDLEILDIYTDTNSPLDDLQQDYQYYGVAGLDKDDEGNLYISHTKDDYPLKILTKSGNWIEISLSKFGLEAPKTADLVYLSAGYIMQVIIDVGILVYNTNGTPGNLLDDESILLTSSPSEGGLPSSQVTCITEDLDGEVWIGTNAGIGIIYTPENIFNPSFEGAQQIIVNQDGFNGYLFGTETIEAISVDGANRKWIGTFSSGLFLISSDGQEQIHSFNIDNSPLLNNKISDIAVHPTSGEVFIASEGGLISYRSDATSAVESLENVRIFPNPVKPNYNGVIAMNNLTANAVVRITNAAGQLVFETTSNGGQAIWDGKDLNGSRVFSGVYLVHISTETTSGGVTKKVLFLD